MGEKSPSGEHEQALGPWASHWMRFIKQDRQKHGVAAARPQGLHLEEAWVVLVVGTELEHDHGLR